MVKVYTGGLYHYEVTGEREVEAAADLERGMDAISRQYWMPGEHVLVEQEDLRNRIERDYNVVCEVVSG